MRKEVLSCKIDAQSPHTEVARAASIAFSELIHEYSPLAAHSGALVAFLTSLHIY